MSKSKNNDNYGWWIFACVVFLIGALVVFLVYPNEIPALILAVASVLCGLRGNGLLMREVDKEIEEEPLSDNWLSKNE